MAKVSVYEQIANKILETMESGVRPWEQCYSVSQQGFAKRVTGEDYRGINRILLTLAMWEKGYRHPVWMTFNQAKKMGGRVRKGEKASLSVFFKMLTVDEIDPETGEQKEVPMVKTNMVFNVEQIDNLDDEVISGFLPALKENDNTPIEQAEAFIAKIPAQIIEANDTPKYIPSKDLVSMPSITQFITSEHYYATFLHELAHWTMHKSRLNRPILQEWNKTNYFKEELCAELTASFLCPSVGIEPLIDAEHAPYLKHYIDLLKDEPKAFMTACAQAEKAADYLRAYQ